MGVFSIGTSHLLRQGRPSVEFSGHATLCAPDGEFIGTTYFSCGVYGNRDHAILETEFEEQNQQTTDIRIAKPIPINSVKQFQHVDEASRRATIMAGIAAAFATSKMIFPVPGIESRFIFESTFETDKEEKAFVIISDERLRFIGVVPERHPFDSLMAYRMKRLEDISFNQSRHVPLDERLHLIRQTSFVVKPGVPTLLEFGFLAVSEFNDCEISVVLKDYQDEVIDSFTVRVRRTSPVVHANVHVAVDVGGSISKKLTSLNFIQTAIAEVPMLVCTVIEGETHVSSPPLKRTLTSLIFLFDNEQAITKIVRLNIDVFEVSRLQVASKGEVSAQQWLGKHLCCKSTDSRVAGFTISRVPVVHDPAKLIVMAHAPGIVELRIWSMTDNCLAAIKLIQVGESQFGAVGQTCIGRCEVKLKVGESVQRQIRYENTKDRTKSIRVTSTHPALIVFQPMQYQIAAGQTKTIRVRFLANTNPDDVTIIVFLQEASEIRKGNEYYKFHVVYEEDDD
jgi:hypothetical protein